MSVEFRLQKLMNEAIATSLCPLNYLIEERGSQSNRSIGFGTKSGCRNRRLFFSRSSKNMYVLLVSHKLFHPTINIYPKDFGVWLSNVWYLERFGSNSWQTVQETKRQKVNFCHCSKVCLYFHEPKFRSGRFIYSLEFGEFFLTLNNAYVIGIF